MAFDWLKSYREASANGHITWFSLDINEYPVYSSTNTLDSNELIAQVSGRFPNGREFHVTFTYKLRLDVSMFGSSSDRKIDISLYAVEAKHIRCSERRSYASKDYYASPPIVRPEWVENTRLTFVEAVRSRALHPTTLSKYDKPMLALLEKVIRDLP